MAELKFKCPDCGHDKLVEEATCEMARTVASGIDNGTYELVDPEPTEMDGDCEIDQYRCANTRCNRLILINAGENIDAADDLIDWLRRHCPQDEEVAKPAGE